MNLAMKITKFWLSKSIFYVKNHPKPSKKFSLKHTKSGAQLILTTLFVYCHFWSTLSTKIWPKFQTLIPNRALFCQRPFKLRRFGQASFYLLEPAVNTELCRLCYKQVKEVLISIQLTPGFDAKVAAKFLNGIYSLCS